jgi:ABC-type molybdate transport system permease subunit
MSIAIYDAVQANRLNDAHVLAIALTLVTLGLLVGVGTLARGGKW